MAPRVALTAALAVGRSQLSGAALDVFNHLSAPLLSLRKVHTGRIVVTLDVAEFGASEIESRGFSAKHGGQGDVRHLDWVDVIEILVEVDVDFTRSRYGKKFFSVHNEHPLKNVFEAIGMSSNCRFLKTTK